MTLASRRASELVKARVIVNRTRLRKLRLDAVCVDCGADGRVAIGGIEFHHLRDKRQAISSMLSRCWRIIELELAKCTPLCWLCHEDRHQ